MNTKVILYIEEILSFIYGSIMEESSLGIHGIWMGKESNSHSNTQKWKGRAA